VSRQLEGRRALVTGGGAGIGRAIVRALAREGARVAVSDLDRAAADDAASEVSGVAFALDVRDAAATAAVVAEAAAALGGLDAAVANAGVSTMARVVDLTESEWDFNMDVNAKGVFLTNQAVVRHFLATGTRGAIVNTASLAAKVGAPLLAHYSASKFAVAGFTQALAREVAPQGIRVNCVCPGFVRTSMQAREVVWEAKLRGLPDDAVRAEYVAQTPLGRLQEPEDVADVVAFLLGDGARFMTGLALDVNGGVFMS
jgi:NAD(P)-dependent dehydrogenase (short-subunit alcohol dehydrogenase family)